MQFCDTADYKSALRARVGRYAHPILFGVSVSGSMNKSVFTKLSVVLLMSMIPLGVLSAPKEPPTGEVPLDPASRLEIRQRQQARSAATQKAFHEFRFSDRTTE